jgi:L-ascorbate metabolism protein UlaG (beta-lactamase superfamily)
MYSGSKYSGPKSDHFNGEEFYNLDKSTEHGFSGFLKWTFNRNPGHWRDFTYTEPGLAPAKHIPGDSLVVTFINHSTVLIQTNSLNIITDPVYSKRVSPVSWTGPKRHRNPGIRFEDLPEIDIVLVSHNHYDHLDIETLKKLNNKFQPMFITTLGNKEFLNDNGIKNAVELDWWQSQNYQDKTKIHCVPARHFTMRGMTDRNKSLWGGFVIESAGGPIYFSGDTGFGKHFQMIHDHFGDLRFALLPIGA